MYRFYRDDGHSLPVTMLGFSELLILIGRSCGLNHMYDPMRFLLAVSVFMFFIMTGYELKPHRYVRSFMTDLFRDTVSVLLPFILVSLFIQSGIVFTSRKLYLLWILLSFYIIRAVYAAANAALIHFGTGIRTGIVWILMLLSGMIGLSAGMAGSGTELSADVLLLPFLPALAGLVLRYFHDRYTFGISYRLLSVAISALLFLVSITSGTYADPVHHRYPSALWGVILSLGSAFFLLWAARFVLRLPVLRDIGTIFGRHPVIVLCVARMDTYIRRTWIRDYAVSTAVLRTVTDLALVLTAALTAGRFRHTHAVSYDRLLCSRYQKPLSVYFYISFACLMIRSTLMQTMIPSSLPVSVTNTWIYRPAAWMACSCILVFAVSLASVNNKIQFAFELALFAAAQIWYHETSFFAIYILLLFILAATGKDFRKIMKIYFFVVLSILVIAWWTSLHGYVTNLIFYRDRVNNLFPRYALGANYVTDLASHWFYLITIVCILKTKKKSWKSFIIYPVLVYIAVYIYHLTNARLNMFATLTVIAVTLAAHIRRFFAEGKVYRRVISVIGYILSFSYVFCLLFSFYMVNNYNMETMEMPFQSVLDRITDLSNLQQRLRISQTALNEYPLTIFGNAYRYHEIGEGGTFRQTHNITFLDISYIKIPFMYGLLIAIILLCVWTFACLCQTRQQHMLFVFILATVAFTGLIEHHLAEYFYNLFSLAIFTAGFMPETSRAVKSGKGDTHD